MKEPTTQKTRMQIITMIHKSLSNGIRNSRADVPRKWLEERKLSIEVTGACFNSGQIHHSKSNEYKIELASVGFLKELVQPTNRGEKAYAVFGTYAVQFPLRNEENEVVNFHAIGIKTGKTSFLNEEGIYPGYPPERTARLFIVNSVLDAATLLESGVMDNREAVIALFDGEWKPQHYEAIAKLKELEEVIYIGKKERL